MAVSARIPRGPGARLTSMVGTVTRVRALPLMSMASVVLAVGLWWLASAALVRDATVLPSPGAVAERAVHLISLGNDRTGLWHNVVASQVRVLIGWGLGVAVGIPVGAVLGGNRVMRALVDPILESGRAVPPLAFAPLLVVWLGIGETSKILLLFLTAFPIVAISTASAIAGVDESLKRSALTLGASRIYMYRRVIVPAAMPEIITSMRIAGGLTWSSLVAAEIIAATSGLGWMILQASNYLDTSTIFVGILAIGLLAFTLDRCLRILQGWVVPWKGRA
jgi:taurine transport system permease protein